MPRAVGSKDYISLTKGLITEASPLAFPEGATTDELNFVLDTDGITRSRRKGLDSVKTDQTESFGPNDIARLQEVLYWQATDLILFVYDKIGQNFGTYLSIHRNNLQMTKVGTYELSEQSNQVFLAQSTNFVSITVGKGNLPYLLEYKEDTAEIELSRITIYVRDFELVDDGLPLTERPSTLSDNHKYNLYNAGWYANRRDSDTGGRPFADPVSMVFGTLTDYPSNADVASLGVRFDSENNFDVFDIDVFRTITVGSTEAPRGHYIYPVGSFDRTSKLTASGKLLDGAPSNTLTSLQTWSV